MSPTLLAAILGGVAIAAVARVTGPAAARTAAHAFARRVDLALTDDVAPRVVDRLAARDRASGVGALVAVAFGGLWAALTEPAETVGGIVVALAFFLGYAAGSALYGWYESTRPVPAGPRIARATTPTHADYIDPVERLGLRIGAFLAPLLIGGLALVDALSDAIAFGPFPVGAAVVAVVCPVVANVAEALGARLVLARPQVAATPHELAWDDALRARTLRDSITAPLIVTLYAPLFYLGVVDAGLEGGWPANPAVGVVSGVFGTYILVLVLLTLLALARRPERHFRRRLWPTAPQAAPAVAGAQPDAEPQP
ncbi:hypothetical protein SAMN04488035_0350 [Flavimobilis marinus]|uniref:Uncharacterized protein n=1 Tax=Flavimobilis marinus TaxID=285351 RepID=A0A1I2D0U4_9MICO|nr:hypothetical protein [Flavimobilis marinus]SFE74187.1 hypothetical protein SAMN04488035_0350 [Flavimobilis marinus]